jgi:hypothetical protein
MDIINISVILIVLCVIWSIAQKSREWSKWSS